MSEENVVIPKRVWTFVAQMSHWLGGYAIVITPLALFNSVRGMWWAAGILVPLAAFKEFYIDENFETADERGSNLLDFIFYLVGIGLALSVAYLTRGFR